MRMTEDRRDKEKIKSPITSQIKDADQTNLTG